MAAAADSSSASDAHSTRLRGNNRNLSSPWSHVVRGEPESTPGTDCPSSPAAATERMAAPGEQFDPPRPGPSIRSPPPPPSSYGGDHGASGNASAPSREKKSPWSAPSNGLTEVEPVMGAVSWPALSEATKNFSKPSSSDSLKALPDGSVPAHLAPMAASPSGKATANNTNSNISANYGRQKSTKRAGGNGSGNTIPSKGGVTIANGRPVPPLLSPTSAEASQGKVVSSEPSTRDLSNRSSSSWDHGSRSGGFSPQPQGEMSIIGIMVVAGGKRWWGRDRGGYDWNQRSFSGNRDAHMQQRQQPRGMARPFIQPPPLVPAPFIPPPPRVSPFGSPIGYHEIPSPVFYIPTPPHETMRGIPFVAPSAVYFAAPDPHLPMMVSKQIDYYFSPENLCRDTYLRQNMDEEGWVPISLIASFNRVKILTDNIQFILETLRTSTVVEVQDGKVRRRNDWMNWPPLTPGASSLHAPESPNPDALAARVRNMGLEDGLSTQNAAPWVAPPAATLSATRGEMNSSGPPDAGPAHGADRDEPELSPPQET
ncbi:unnamed protein product [Spirodela intermedia]|uniref:HTH La-type RNA-binding domain-containing protein n=1 Tax=Spirodela intermedia TaxID=51605 RepID=A0A7I8IZ19_SPIIN|nr:unnamed protein product [Spirodela intermedia]CAA6663235.1 unnamed protein product [Spirodela intermedia]